MEFQTKLPNAEIGAPQTQAFKRAGASPWTGCRGVSLPFTDVCFPLKTIEHGRRVLYELAMEHGRRSNWKSLEYRGNEPAWEGALPSLAFYGHVIDLEDEQEALFKRFNGAVRRAIRKAVRTGLRVESATVSTQFGRFTHCTA